MSIALTPGFDRDRAMTRAFKRAIVASLVVHFLFLATVGISAGLHLRPKWKPPTIKVGFYAPPGGKKGGNKTEKPKTLPAPEKKDDKPPEKKEPKPTEKKDTKPPEKKDPAKKELAKNTPPPKKDDKKDAAKKDDKKDEKKPEPVKPEESKPEPVNAGTAEKKDTAPEDLIRDLEKEDEKAGEKPEPAGPGDGGTGNSEFEGALNGIKGDPTMQTYYGEVLKVILESWRLPPGVPPNQDLHFDVYITIDPEGKVLKYEVKEKSSNQALNRSVLTFLEELQKLPAPPANLAGVNQGKIDLPFRFQPEY